ncbi:MAG TPA: helix-turn-helix transcriptional regulator [Pyrinomonadaceae bacterium]|nr:helix-turn-helix transcriptional regulator [Pyrinomonadaceae bacterium]
MKNLANIRREKNVSQIELAAMVGLYSSTLSRYEHGRHEPLLSTAVAIADALGCTVDDLVRLAEGTSRVS